MSLSISEASSWPQRYLILVAVWLTDITEVFIEHTYT